MRKKAKILIISIWIFSVALCLSILIVYWITRVNMMLWFPLIFMLPANIIYIVLASLSYAYIFYNFNKSRILPHGGKGTNDTKALSFCHVFRKSRFFIPMSLIFIYICFHAIPTILFILYSGVLVRKYMRIYIALSYNIAMLFDASICIFSEPFVQKQLKKMNRMRRERGKIKDEQRQNMHIIIRNKITPQTGAGQRR